MLANMSLGEERLILNPNQSISVGLQILIATSKEKHNNIVTKRPSLRSDQSCRIFPEFCNNLKRCHLCKNNLRQDKDVYMYRGDVGFCSVECRNKQILMDERKEFEVSTKRMLASYRNCGAGKTETQILLDDLRRRRHRRQVTKLYI